MRVVSLPPIQFTCSTCRAVNEGDAREFFELGTMPPTFAACCAACGSENVVSPPVLVRLVAAQDFDQAIDERIDCLFQRVETTLRARRQ